MPLPSSFRTDETATVFVVEHPGDPSRLRPLLKLSSFNLLEAFAARGGLAARLRRVSIFWSNGWIRLAGGPLCCSSFSPLSCGACRIFSASAGPLGRRLPSAYVRANSRVSGIARKPMMENRSPTPSCSPVLTRRPCGGSLPGSLQPPRRARRRGDRALSSMRRPDRPAIRCAVEMYSTPQRAVLPVRSMRKDLQVPRRWHRTSHKERSSQSLRPGSRSGATDSVLFGRFR